MARTVETYEQAIEFLFGRINYERVHRDYFASGDFKLDRTRQLLSLLGNPQERIPVVHIAGTKGKGSTAVMTAEILAATGRRVGLFTSPHLDAFEERMKVNGVVPSPDRLVDLVNTVSEPVARLDREPGRMRPTYFEIATAMAWQYFEQEQVDIVVLEVGLGGRLDCTNVSRPIASAITSISRDHTHVLGSHIEQIAREKAGIVKKGVCLVSGVEDQVAQSTIEQVCREQSAPIWNLGRQITMNCCPQPPTRNNVGSTIDVMTPIREWSNVPVPLLGDHQARNAAVTIGLIDVLHEQGYSIARQSVYDGMALVRWPLRMEVVHTNPIVVVDAAHNWASAKAVVKTLEKSFAKARRRILVFGTTKDKDISGLLRLLIPRFDTVILTNYLNNPRAVDYDELHRRVSAICPRPVHLASNPAQAWQLAQRLANEDDLICVTGSFFIAAEMRELVLDEAKQTTLDTEATFR